MLLRLFAGENSAKGTVSFNMIRRHVHSARGVCGFVLRKVAEQLKVTVAHEGRLDVERETINLERLSRPSALLGVPILQMILNKESKGP